jgi:hypothetical protein
MKYTKRTARELLRADTDADLARFFNINRSAVALWGEDAPLPPARQEILARVTKRELRLDAGWRSRPDKARGGE